MPPESPRISRQELFRRLGDGHAARPTVLAPNRRLAQALQAAFDRERLAEGRLSWEEPDILPFGDFVARCHDEVLHGQPQAPLAQFLPAAAARLLWEEVLRAGGWQERLHSLAPAAALAAKAWGLAHAWRLERAIEEPAGGEDAMAFAQWSGAYRRRLEREGLVDAAMLPGVVAEQIARGALALPPALVLYAFDIVTPAQRDFLAACERAGVAVEACVPPRFTGLVRRVELASPREELEQAALWARDRLERSNAARIGVVVPALAGRRAQVERAFARVFAPHAAPGSRGAELFNVSLGLPLASYPLVDAALDTIELAGATLDYDRASRWLRSPFIAGAEAEAPSRARFDAALRRIAPPTLSLSRLRGLVPEIAGRRAPECPHLLASLDRMIVAAGDAGRATPHAWAGRFTALLDAAGFPGERTLDSDEYQALERWRRALRDLSALGAVAASWSAAEARTQLRRLCAEEVFQPASGGAPIQVLGILESSGLAFDHLWVSGLTEEAWPLAARPDPLIAPALQRAAGIPQASAELSLELDASITRAWAAAAPEVVFSSARSDEDREPLPSPLIGAYELVPLDALGFALSATAAQALLDAGARPGGRGMRADTVAPPVPGMTSAGGTRVLADQAACPFRAFAHVRLEARSLESPQPCLDASDRGVLLHVLMAELWNALGDQATLRATSEDRLQRLIDAASAAAVAAVQRRKHGRLEGAFAELERERLARVAREWLELESARPPFEVRMREQRMALFAGGLRLEGRVDRVDRLLDARGGLAVIDYKSGQAKVADWLGARPDDGQLPLYALAVADEEVRAIAFARLKVGERGFVGLTRDRGALPGVAALEDHRQARAQASSWTELLEQWREEMDALGDGFAGGDARVDPKRGLATCRLCDLAALCRVHERLVGVGADDPVDDLA